MSRVQVDVRVGCVSRRDEVRVWCGEVWYGVVWCGVVWSHPSPRIIPWLDER